MPEVRHKFIVYGNPRGKARPRFFKNHAYTDAATTEYEGRVRRMWKSENFYKLPKQPTKVIIDAFFRVPVSLPKKRREALFNTPHLKKPDGDNIAKIILDALNTVAWADDSQISTLYVRKMYVGSEDEQPRVEVTIIGEGESENDD